MGGRLSLAGEMLLAIDLFVKFGRIEWPQVIRQALVLPAHAGTATTARMDPGDEPEKLRLRCSGSAAAIVS